MLRLGEELFADAAEQIEQSDDEGETAEEVATSMAIVIKALSKCSLPALDKGVKGDNHLFIDNLRLCCVAPTRPGTEPCIWFLFSGSSPGQALAFGSYL